MARGRVATVFALCLLGNAFSVPVDVPRLRRGYSDNELDSEETQVDMSTDTSSVDEPSYVPINPAVTLPPIPDNYAEKRKEFHVRDTDGFNEDNDDDDFPESLQTSSSAGGGSNILSLLRLANGLFPSSAGNNLQATLSRMIRQYLRRYPLQLAPLQLPLPQNKVLRRQFVKDNEIEIDYPLDLKPPPFQRQESDENGSDSDSSASVSIESEENDAAEEESLEDDDNGDDNGNASQQNSDSKPASDGNGNDDDDDDGEDDGDKDDGGDKDDDNDSDYDSDEPPEGDGQGGGILGILAGLSGDDGQSDLGSLLATVSGIVVNLSGDGIDVNSIIASAIGLFVGLLSEGNENPGSIIASYLLTSLDTITGGGAKNNGQFFGKFLSKLISGTSAGEAPEGASDESGEPETMKDSAGFVLGLLAGLSGDMSASSSKGSSKPW